MRASVFLAPWERAEKPEEFIGFYNWVFLRNEFSFRHGLILELNDAIGFIDSVTSIIPALALIFLSLHRLSKNPTKHSPEAESI